MRQCEAHVGDPRALIGQNSDAPRPTSCNKNVGACHTISPLLLDSHKI